MKKITDTRTHIFVAISMVIIILIGIKILVMFNGIIVK